MFSCFSWTHTLLTKLSHGQICAWFGRHYACCGQYCAWRGKIWPKISLPKGSFIIFWKFFLSFLGFSMVKIHFFQKVLKKWSSFRKKLLYILPLLWGRGGGSGPKVEFSTFFLTLPYKECNDILKVSRLSLLRSRSL